MIYDQKVKIRCNPKNKKHYLEKGYDVPKTGEYFFVSVHDLLPSTSELVKCKCDICGRDFYRKFCYLREIHACSDECVQELRERTIFNKYKCKNIGQSKELNVHKKEKLANTKYEKNLVKTSKNQKHLCELFHGILNYPIGDYNVDIALINEQIVIEYDGKGHFEWIKDEIKELNRENYIVNKGFKLIRIESRSDILLNDSDMIKLVNFAKYLNKKKVYINLEDKRIAYYDSYSFEEIL